MDTNSCEGMCLEQKSEYKSILLASKKKEA